MKLKFKIWLLLSALISVVLAIDLRFSYLKLESESRKEAEYDARTIYGYMMATRRVYQQQFINSGLPVNEKTLGFLPAHSLSRISRDFANWNHNMIVFNNVTDQPRNLNNRADRFELEAMHWFRDHPKAIEHVQDIITDQGVGYMLYTAPILIEPFCLKCHGDRATAPATIRDRYDTAYGYKIGDLRGVASIRIPKAKFEERLFDIWSGQLIKSLVGYASIFLALGLILDQLVTRRLSRLQEGTQRIAAGEYGTRISQMPSRTGPDEITKLAETFNFMADEVQNRDQTLVKFSLAVEQSPESIVITDLNGCVNYVNEAFVRITGYSREEAIGSNPRVLQSGKTPPDTYRALWSAVTHGEVWQGEFTNLRKDGREYIESAIIRHWFS